MKKKKMAYEAPISNALEVHSEGFICASKFGGANQAGNGFGESGEYTYNY